MNTTMEISDQIRPLTSAELEAASGGMLHAGFRIGCTRIDIVASEYDYIVIKTDCSCGG